MQGNPLRNQLIRVGFFIPEPWKESKVSATTDENGKLVISSPLRLEKDHQVLIVAAGAVNQGGKHLGGNIIFLY